MAINKIVYGQNTLIDLTGDTVSGSKMLSGTTAHDKSGSAITGSIQSKSAATITPGASAQTIAAGQYLSGTQTIAGDANLIPANIAKDVSIFGVTGTHAGSGANLQTKTVIPKTSQQNVTPDSGYDGLSSVTVNAIQAETLTITSNGTYLPTLGKYFSSVYVNVSGGGATVQIDEGEGTIDAGGRLNLSWGFRPDILFIDGGRVTERSLPVGYSTICIPLFLINTVNIPIMSLGWGAPFGISKQICAVVQSISSTNCRIQFFQLSEDWGAIPLLEQLNVSYAIFKFL